MDLNRTVNIKNRSAAEAGYTLSDANITRNWTPGEVKKHISVGELEQVTYIPGGLVILQDYLLINDEEVCEYLGITAEPEYFYSEDDIKTLITTGSLEQFLDCLDFAPDGVIDLVKRYALELRMNSMDKRQALKEATGFDVTSAIANVDYANADDHSNEKPARKRRTKPVGETKVEETSGRRSAPVKKYTRVENK